MGGIIEKECFCSFCGKKFNTLNGKNGHISYCKENPNRKQAWNKGLTKDDERVAKYTQSMKATKNSDSFRENHPAWNKGLTKDTDERVAKYSESMKTTKNSKEYKKKNKENIYKKYGNRHFTQTEEYKEKIKQRSLKNYGEEYYFKTERFKEKFKNTCMKKYSVEFPMQSEQIKETRRQNNLKKYGCINPSMTRLVKDKVRNTCFERYGVKNVFCVPKVKEKIKRTYLEHYGVDSPFKSEEVRNKIKKTIFTRYGVENASQSSFIKKKVKETCIEKYGTNFQKVFLDKRNKTNLKKYGTTNLMSVPSILDKVLSYRRKEYRLPSGKIINIQGYEPFAMDILFDLFELKEEEIETLIPLMPSIYYFSNGKKRRYYPDIFIEKFNLIIEVKSEYTFKYDIEKNIQKQKACLKLGYKHEFWIFDGKGNILRRIKNYENE